MFTNGMFDFEKMEQAEILLQRKIHGTCQGDSSAERSLLSSIKTALANNLNTKYNFCFNLPITDFGIPSRYVRLQDIYDEYIDFTMKRCLVDREDAVSLMNKIENQRVRLRTLKLDVGKRIGNKLIAGIELNGPEHYEIPEDEDAQKIFARKLFTDCVKEIELRRIAQIYVADLRTYSSNGVGSLEHLNIANEIYSFANEM